MNRLKWRFLLYILTGLAFGVIDWFYLNWLAHISWGSLEQSILVVPIIFRHLAGSPNPGGYF
jgi:hypothetical protein